MPKVLTKADIDLLKEIKTHLETEGSRNDLATGLQTLLASMEPGPHKNPRAKPCKKVVDLLMDIDNEICDQQGAPHGRNSDRQAQRKGACQKYGYESLHICPPLSGLYLGIFDTPYIIYKHL